MKLSSIVVTLFTTVAVLNVSSASAANKPIKGTLPASFVGSELVAIAADGSNATSKASITSTKFSIVPPASKARLYIRSADGDITAQVVNAVCQKSGGYTKCSGKSSVSTSFKQGASIGKLSFKSGGALAASLKGDNYKKNVIAGSAAQAANFVPIGIATKGLKIKVGTTGKDRYLGLRSVKSMAESEGDQDQDGLVDAIDADNDGDGTPDNTDRDSNDSTGTGGSGETFVIFSNLKLDLDRGLNVHTTGLTQAKIDNALQSTQSLATQVAGATTDTVELDCGGLSYCSAGGTGRANGIDFPGTAGGTVDSDSDGYGTITRGPTGDFQLETRTTSTEIGSGDTFVEHITNSSGTETLATSMLNYVAVSTPGIRSITVNGTTTTIDYTAFIPAGSRNNCLTAPATGDVTVTVVTNRPQRPGNSSAGEAEYVDIGKLLYNFDIPNGPSSGLGGGPGSGNCTGLYSSTDSNLTVTNDGAQDNKSDQDTDSANTLSFTANISSCLGSLAWTSGQTLFIDVQAKSNYGDNSATKFCITRL